MLPAQPNQGLIDGIRCLQALAISKGPIGVSEMAKRMLMEPTRVHRLLKTLVHMGMAQQDEGRRYMVGVGVQVLANLSRMGSELERRGQESIRLLSREVGHTVVFGVMWEGMVSYLAGREGGEMGGTSHEWERIEEASTCCIGLVLLAGKRDEEVERIYYGRPIPGFVGGLGDLRRRLSEIQVRTYAYLTGAGGEEPSALALAFTDGVSALEVRGPITEEECQDLGEVLRQVILTVERSWRWSE